MQPLLYGRNSTTAVLANIKPPVKYKNAFLRIPLCVLSAVLVALYGSGAQYLDRISSRSFPVKFAAALIISAFFLEFVHRVTLTLDRKYDWKESPLLRLYFQFLLGVLLPGLVDFLFLSLYKWYFGLSQADDSAISQGSLSFMLMPVFVFNMYYLVYYHLLRHREKKKGSKFARKMLLVTQGNRTLPIPLDEVRYIYHRDRVNFLVTAGATEYVLSESLDELEAQLPKRDFFRLNRQILINFSACSHFQPHGHGKLLVQPNPPFRQEMVVSQARATKFREWISR